MRVCIFGDSIAWGSYDPDMGGWANRLRNHIELQNEDAIEIYNLSICGDSTKEVLKRLPTEAGVRKPEGIIYAIGINDSQRQPGGDNLISFETFQKNIKRLVSEARHHTQNVTFIGLTNVDETKTMPYYSNTEIGRYDLAIQELCERENIRYVSLAGILGIADFEDGLHPNSQGHKKIFERIKTQIPFLH
jgi:lysophospholipase L1-like esterase